MRNFLVQASCLDGPAPSGQQGKGQPARTTASNRIQQHPTSPNATKQRPSTMKIVGPVLTAAAAYFVGLASAAPAIVWKNNGSNISSLTSHISNAMDARSLLASVGITGNNDNDASSSSALSAVIFLVERNTDAPRDCLPSSPPLLQTTIWRG